jgi:hypothetical protein
MKAINIFNDCLSGLGKTLLSYLQSGNETRMLLYLANRATQHSDYVGSHAGLIMSATKPLSGCYLFWGVKDNGDIVIWMYVGRSRDIVSRAKSHIRRSLEVWPAAENEKSLLYSLSKRTRIIHVACISKANTIQPDLDNAVCEAIWCALLGTYQRDHSYVVLRAKVGLPVLDVIGGNSTACQEGPTTVNAGKSDNQWCLRELRLSLAESIA